MPNRRYDGALKGFVAYHRPKGDARRAAFIDEIIVARQGRGVGTALLNKFAGMQVELRMHFNNKRARRLYERFRFQPCAGDTKLAAPSGYPATRGFRCLLSTELPRVAPASAAQPTHVAIHQVKSWDKLSPDTQKEMVRLMHAKHRTYTKARVQQILTPSDGPPCQFLLAY